MNHALRFSKQNLNSCSDHPGAGFLREGARLDMCKLLQELRNIIGI